ncbi:putative helicase mov-10-B.1 [Hylaeus volcanicus]|uniref:putative helicase mov-10-B.1 n=1 Tax=Hylaeus volcanicus TaxID=313075 RepID=UPI0023B7EC3C|nr:putative helicase mov-10-B.1 [Hylaeus volcanicus]
MANNTRRKNQRPSIWKSTHCTSFGLSGQLLPLQEFKVPPDLQKALKNHFKESPEDSKLCRDYIKLIIHEFPNVKKIKPEHYLVLFKIFLYMEDHELKLLAAEYNLKSQSLKQLALNKCVITIPKLDEDDPFIKIGDMVKIQDISGAYTCNCPIIDIEGKNVICEIKQNHMDLAKTLVNVHFCKQNLTIKYCHFILHMIDKYNLIDLLYPKINTNHYVLPQVTLDWVQKTVAKNPEQREAVINILNNSAHPAPYVIFGPPGTGKTTTLVEAICQIRNQHRTKNVLVCAFSNAAADEIARRLITLLPSKDIFRMYAASMHWEDVDKTIVPNSNFVDDKVLYLPKDIFILKKIVIVTLMTCMRLVSLNLRSDHFSYIFIDEASQSTELESLVPFTLACSQNKKSSVATLNAQIIITGDPYQLGPIVRCKQINHLLGKSLLERLMECEPYQKVDNKYNSRYITKLIRNYRSLEPILHVSNKLFYENELLCCKEPSTNKINLNWSVMANKTFPILFLAVDGKEKRTENKSVYNLEEIAIVGYYIKKLLDAKVKEKNIGVITPFKKQKVMIYKYLNEHGFKDITVGTVEVFQGQEKEVIILTTVRSESFKHDGKEHIGFLSNAMRFNVAVTRAKNLLIVVGNPTVLCKDKCWKALWDYCDKNNACSILDVVGF